MSSRILIVDDEESILRLLSFNLEKEGYESIFARDGLEALEKARAEDPDLIVLDLMLPKMDGLEVCRRLRADKVEVPIIILTAKGEEIDTILGLELGADDYLTKPFSPRVLLARIRAVLRRASSASQTLQAQGDPSLTTTGEGTRVTLGDLSIDSERYEVTAGGRPVSLTAREFELLDFLTRNAGRIFSREQLIRQVWNYDYAGDTRIVDVHVSHLREKIEPDPRNPVYIKTVRGVGYKFREEKG
ncbi:MAG: response regulator transcription factor [Firmicutes bacterium]|nr:response regulator transcription factor [Bacillota bacterium]